MKWNLARQKPIGSSAWHWYECYSEFRPQHVLFKSDHQVPVYVFVFEVRKQNPLHRLGRHLPTLFLRKLFRNGFAATVLGFTTQGPLN